jgi:hypothetical protein
MMTMMMMMMMDMYLSPFPDPCKALKRRIYNKMNDIAKRVKELKTNPQRLPERAPGDVEKPSSSVWGHQQIINDLKKDLDDDISLYKNHCQPPPPCEVGSESSQPAKPAYLNHGLKEDWGFVGLVAGALTYGLGGLAARGGAAAGEQAASAATGSYGYIGPPAMNRAAALVGPGLLAGSDSCPSSSSASSGSGLPRGAPPVDSLDWFDPLVAYYHMDEGLKRL